MAIETESPTRPIIALAIGDPAGIGPELAAKLVADPDVRAAASLLVVGDRRVLDRGAEQGGVMLDVDVRTDTEAAVPGSKPLLIDLGHLDPDDVNVGLAAAAGGRFALKNFTTCLQLAAAGRAGAVCFTPFNKAAMRLGHPAYDDEIGYTAEVLRLNDVPASELARLVVTSRSVRPYWPMRLRSTATLSCG